MSLFIFRGATSKSPTMNHSPTLYGDHISANVQVNFCYLYKFSNKMRLKSINYIFGTNCCTFSKIWTLILEHPNFVATKINRKQYI